MKRIGTLWVSTFLAFVTILAATLQAQQSSPGPGIAEAASSQAASPRVLSFSDAVAGQPDGALTVTFAIYPDQQSTIALWTETQVVQITQGKYTALLGSTTATGIPSDSFVADQARWLGVQVNGTEKRYLLVSVPYAMKAVEAERLGGLLSSEYVTVAQLQSALQNAAATSSSTASGGGKTAGAAPLAAASGTPPQPATDFTDNNASEVLLVTQQGTGFAIHAISAGDAALFGENSTATGTAVRALASATSGANIGLLGQSASPDGIAGVLDNTGGGKILSLRSNGSEVASVDSLGNVQAQSFFGSGFGLSNIPPAAVGAQSGNVPGTIVARDFSGSFSANAINAGTFSGSGAGLFNIPPGAVGAQSGNVPFTIVLRDFSGSFSANAINAGTFVGSGAGLFNIPPGAVGAQSDNVPFTIVARDFSGSFSANAINAGTFFGSGAGLLNIPPVAVGAQSSNVANSIVLRDSNGNFSAGGIEAFGQTDFTNATSTAPIKAVLAANTPTSCLASKELLIKTDALPGQQLFICNAAGTGYVLVGDGTTAGVTSVGAGDSSVTVGGTAAAPTVAVANGGITSAKLAPGAVTSGSIASGTVTSAQLASNAVTNANVADGALSGTKIAGTAATLSSNTFAGNQTMQQNLTVSGNLTAGPTSISGFSGSPLVTVTQSGSSVALLANGQVLGVAALGGTEGLAASGTTYGVNTNSTNGIALNAASTSSYGVFSSSAKAIGLHADGATVGGDFSTGSGVALQATTTTNGGVPAIFTAANTSSASTQIISGRIGIVNSTFERFSLDTDGNLFNAGATVSQYPGDPGSLGLVVALGGNQFTNPAIAVTVPHGASAGAIGISLGAGSDPGTVRIATSGRVDCFFDNQAVAGDYVGISKVFDGQCTDLGTLYPSSGQVLGRVAKVSLMGVVTILLFGPEHQGLGGSVTTINTGSGLTGGPITASGTISIANAGVTNSMLQNSSVIVSAGTGLSGGGTVPLGGSVTLNNTGVLSFQGRTGNVLPAANDYSFSQISGAVSPSQLPPTIVYNNTGNDFTGRQVITGSFGVNDTSAANGSDSLEVFSQNNVAGAFLSGGPMIFVAQSTTSGGGMNVAGDGTVTASGNVFGAAFIGDGSRLTNVNAASLGGVTSANLATTSTLASETAARQAGDAGLATSISAETAARQSDTSNLQASINNLGAADAKLATANTFTASNTFSGGTQDFSGAGATLPIRSLSSAQAPASCVASKELLIKTDAPAGQQLFICDAGGTTWNLVGDGASGGVTSFNGRNGSVSPSSGDYVFSQISGSLATSQLPALTGDVTEAAGSGFTLLAPTGVTSGVYTKVTVDLKGRVVNGAQASFSDLLGSATQSQLPVNVVYNNQANTFSGGLTVNGSVMATFFNGNGGGLSNVNAATVNNLPATSFAQLGASSNAFTGGVSAPSFSGDGSALTNVNASTVNNLQMLKLTASITPAVVNHQSCSEQSFTVSGVNSGDVLLSVQNATHSPGTNIAIGGWRVSANNTVAIQFCNVNGSSSTPAAGTYTFALMR